MVNIKKLAGLTNLSIADTVKYVLNHSNKINYKLLYEKDGNIFIGEVVFDEIVKEYRVLLELTLGDMTMLMRGCVHEAFTYSKPVIYFLFKGDELIYIGQTVSPSQRIQQHTRTGKDFDRFYLHECAKHELSRIEAINIHYWKPRDNKHYYDNKQIFKFVLKACCFE